MYFHLAAVSVLILAASYVYAILKRPEPLNDKCEPQNKSKYSLVIPTPNDCRHIQKTISGCCNELYRHDLKRRDAARREKFVRWRELLSKRKVEYKDRESLLATHRDAPAPFPTIDYNDIRVMEADDVHVDSQMTFDRRFRIRLHCFNILTIEDYWSLQIDGATNADVELHNGKLGQRITAWYTVECGPQEIPILLQEQSQRRYGELDRNGKSTYKVKTGACQKVTSEQFDIYAERFYDRRRIRPQIPSPPRGEKRQAERYVDLKRDQRQCVEFPQLHEGTTSADLQGSVPELTLVSQIQSSAALEALLAEAPDSQPPDALHVDAFVEHLEMLLKGDAIAANPAVNTNYNPTSLGTTVRFGHAMVHHMPSQMFQASHPDVFETHDNGNPFRGSIASPRVSYSLEDFQAASNTQYLVCGSIENEVANARLHAELVQRTSADTEPLVINYLLGPKI